MLGVFATDVKRLTTNLHEAATARDLAAFKRVAHGLAGAAGAVGAKSLEQACRAAMMRSETSPGELQTDSAAIDILADRALEELSLFIAQLDSAARQEG